MQHYLDVMWDEIQLRRVLNNWPNYKYPPTKCRWCAVVGHQNFYRDTIQTETYRCRLCGTEHYKEIIYATGSHPKLQGD